MALAALNINDGAVVTLGALAPAPSFPGDFGGETSALVHGGTQAVPEPGSVALLFGGIMTLLGLRRRS